MKKNIFAALFLLAPAFCAAAEAPNLLTYQGRLKESGLAVTGNRTVEISLCSAETAGICTTSDPQPVAVVNGLFRSTFAVPGTVDLATGAWWLEIRVEGTTLTPRERLTSGAYALFAATAGYVSGSVAKAGDNMTGQLTLDASSLTVRGGDIRLDNDARLAWMPDGEPNDSYLTMSRGPGYFKVIQASNESLVLTGGNLAIAGSLAAAGSDFSVGGSTLATKYGRVGVGTSDPQAPLDIVSTGTASDIYAQIWRNGGGTIVASMTSQGTLFAALPPGAGDNLGNHTATQALQAGVFGVNTSSDITAARYQINGSTVLAVLPGLKSLAAGEGAGRLSQANENTLVGYNAGNNTTSGGSNSFFGALAGEVNGAGGNNAFFGAYSGHDNSGGTSNSFYGLSSGYNNNTGNENSYFGVEAGRYNESGVSNVAVGVSAAKGVSGNSFSNVVALGHSAGLGLTTGSDNVFVGASAGAAVTSGAGNIVLGSGQAASAPDANSELNIGGVLYGSLSARTIGISTRVPQAALDLVSTGTAANIYAQIWRNGGGTIVASMTSQGTLFAALPPGAGDNLGNHAATQGLNMNGQNIDAAAQLTVSTITGPGTAAIYVNQNLSVPASRVAIGAATPDQQLTVAGNISQTGVLISSGSGDNYFAGKVGIGDTTPSYALDVNYTIRAYSPSGANGMIILGDGDIAHGVTGVAPTTDTFGLITAASPTGGLHLQVFSSAAGAAGMYLGGIIGSADPTDSVAAVQLEGAKKNGVAAQAVGALETVFGVRNYGGANLLTMLGSGNVGIGTIAPGHKLDVQGGDINASGALCIADTCKSSWANIDNLGDHTATQNLDLAQHSLLAVSSLTMYGAGLQIATDLTSSGNGIFISTAGSLQTLGLGNGSAAPGPRGIGAVDLQTKRTAADQVASGIYSVIGGGYNNKASTPGSVVAGGQNNYAGINSYATVSGGTGNSALMTYATVGGGSSNAAIEAWAFVGGGGSNKAHQTGAAVTGGQFNVASASNSAVGGGIYNTVTGTSAVIPGGENNSAAGMWSGVAGGRNNAAEGRFASIGGGDNNAVSGDYSSIAGGLDNSVTQPEAFIGGGQGNSVTQSWSVVAGGNYNTASGQRAFVGGGVYNTAGGTASMVPGGWKNSAVASYSFAAGKGSSSTASGSFTWADSKTEADSGYYLENTVEDRAVFKAVGGFMVVNSTDTALYGTRNRGVFVTGDGLLGVSTGTPGAALDVVSAGTAANIQAQIWRNSSGVIVSSLSSTGLLSVSSITATGRVGIGTLAPRSLLDVWGDVLYLGKTGLVHGEIKSDDSLSLSIDANSDQNNAFLEIKGGGASMAIILQPGVMGIGTSDPKAALDVKSTGTVSNVYAQIWRNSSGVVVSSLNSAGLLSVGSMTVTGTGRIALHPVQAADTGMTIATADFGKTITVTAGTPQIITLPAISAENIGAEITVVKLGTGGVTIQAYTFDAIAGSTVGGTIANGVVGETSATITLRIVSLDKWVVINSTGTWSTT